MSINRCTLNTTHFLLGFSCLRPIQSASASLFWVENHRFQDNIPCVGVLVMWLRIAHVIFKGHIVCTCTHPYARSTYPIVS